MPTRVAVMDLGTNTFHLLIAEKGSPGFEKLCHLENSARLGEDGMPDGLIKPEAFERGVEAMRDFKKAIDEFKPSEVKALGTSALRSAKNGIDFIERVKSDVGIHIESIDGDAEAAYIYKGVKTTGLLSADVSLIVDIGGGSIEFIIADDDRIFWKHSYEIGAARLMKRFHLSDPIHAEEIIYLQQDLDKVLPEMYEQAKLHQVKNIIGSSGAFETFAVLAELQSNRKYDINSTPTYLFEANTIKGILDKIISSTHDERAANKDIISVRVDMIVVASVVTRYLMQKLNIDNVAMSVYSLKEGVLADMFG